MIDGFAMKIGGLVDDRASCKRLPEHAVVLPWDADATGQVRFS